VNRTARTAMKKIIPLLLVAAILGGFAWTLRFLYERSKAPDVVHETESPVVTDIVRKTVATGAIVPREEIDIKPRVSGVIAELFVEPGNLVKKGDRIAKIRLIPNVVNLNQAESSRRSAQIALQLAKAEYERLEGLYAQNILAREELDRAASTLSLRREEVQAAQSNISLLKEGASGHTKQASTDVASTVDGMVLALPVKVGVSVIESNTFNEGTTIATVADMSDMIFLGKVDESDVGKLREGMQLHIKVGALEDTAIAGKLEYIAPKGVTREGAIEFEIRAAIDPRTDGPLLRAGYSANADIVLDRRDQVLAIPENLLQFDGDRAFVEVEVGPQQFEQRPVELGLSDGIKVEVRGGVAADTLIKRPERRGAV
jgi:HlyD family secretion protein